MTANGTHWTLITLFASVCAGLLALLLTHQAAPKHPEAAHENAVNSLAVRLERVATDVDHNTSMLSDVRSDLSSLRAEQRASTESILEAIKRN